jgi:hypothetical protein
MANGVISPMVDARGETFVFADFGCGVVVGATNAGSVEDVGSSAMVSFIAGFVSPTSSVSSTLSVSLDSLSSSFNGGSVSVEMASGVITSLPSVFAAKTNPNALIKTAMLNNTTSILLAATCQ